MNLLVFTNGVPATQEEEPRIINAGKDVDLSKVSFKVNDWDNYAVEEAVHIAGMKDSDCIIVVNKDAEAPIFQYAHFGIIADIYKVRDKLKSILTG